MNAQKRMGKKGTLTIPQHLRHQLGFQGGTALDITATEDGGLDRKSTRLNSSH